MRASKATKEQAALLLCVAAAESEGRPYRGLFSLGAEYQFPHDAVVVAFASWCHTEQHGGAAVSRLRAAERLFAEVHG